MWMDLRTIQEHGFTQVRQPGPVGLLQSALNVDLSIRPLLM